MQKTASSPDQTQAMPVCVATLHTPLFSFVRVSRDDEDADAPIVTIPQADAYTAIIQLQRFTLHKLWRDGRLVHAGGHAQYTMALTDLHQAYRCQHISAFDNVRIQLNRPELDKLSYELTGARSSGLQPVQQVADPVMSFLAQALLPALHQGDSRNALFIELVMIAMAAHLMRRYGRQQETLEWRATACRLAERQQAQAKEYMMAHLSGEFTLEDVARHCGMSRAQFARAFKNSLGMTPFSWVRIQRVERAKRLLSNTDLTLAQISVDCGFADQSHFTRVFAQLTGTSPRNWRTAARVRTLY